MKVLGINHVTLLVTDKEKARDFYVNILGLEEYRVGKSLWIKVGDQFLHINKSNGAPIKETFYHFAIIVEDLTEYLNKLISNDLEIYDLDDSLNKININSNLDLPHRLYFTHDPDGNLIEFIDSKNNFYFGK